MKRMIYNYRQVIKFEFKNPIKINFHKYKKQLNPNKT